MKNQSSKNNIAQTAKDICKELELDYDKTIGVFIHLGNQRFIVPVGGNRLIQYVILK